MNPNDAAQRAPDDDSKADERSRDEAEGERRDEPTDIVCTDEAELARQERDPGEVPGTGINVGAGIAGVMPVRQERPPRSLEEGDSEPDPSSGCGP